MALAVRVFASEGVAEIFKDTSLPGNRGKEAYFMLEANGTWNCIVNV